MAALHTLGCAMFLMYPALQVFVNEEVEHSFSRIGDCDGAGIAPISVVEEVLRVELSQADVLIVSARMSAPRVIGPVEVDDRARASCNISLMFLLT